MSLNYDDSTAAGRKTVQLIQALEEVKTGTLEPYCVASLENTFDKLMLVFQPDGSQHAFLTKTPYTNTGPDSESTPYDHKSSPIKI